MECKKLFLFLFSIILLSSLGSAAVYVNTTESTGYDLNAGTANIYPASGMRIYANDNGTIVSIIKDSDTNATTAYIMNASNFILGTATFVGVQANLSVPINIAKGNFYYLLANNTVGGYNQRYRGAITLPINTGTINWTNSVNEFYTNSTTDIQIITGAIIQVGYGANLSLNSPIDNYNSISTTIDFNCSVLSDTRILNLSLYLDGIINYTIYNTTSIQNLSLYKTLNLSYQTYKWNCLAVDTDNAQTWATNRTLNINRYIISQMVYNTSVYETQTSGFTLNLTYDSTLYTSIFANLIYNQISYSTISIGSGKNWLFTKSMDISLTNGTNKTFYYELKITNSSGSVLYANTSIYQQIVNSINLNICNSTYNVSYINFTLKDEETLNVINGSIFTTFNYWLGGGGVYKNYSYSNNSNTAAKFDFCFSPINQIIKTNMDMEYSAPTHSDREKYLRNATLTNVSSLIDLYVLNESSYVKFFFTVTENLFLVEDAVVVISKYNPGIGEYQTIGIRMSDNLGEFVEYLELDKNYKFSISKDLEFLAILTKTSTCTVAPCQIDLEITAGEVDMWEGWYSIYATNIASSLSYNSTTKMVTYIFTDLTGLATYFRLEVTKLNYNQTGTTICNITSYTTSGSITCNLTSYTGDFTAKTYISRSPELLDKIINILQNAMKEILGNEGLFFAFMIILVCALIGFWNPVVGIILTCASLFFVNVMGLLELNLTVIVVIIILGGFMIIKMSSGSRSV